MMIEPLTSALHLTHTLKITYLSRANYGIISGSIKCIDLLKESDIIIDTHKERMKANAGTEKTKKQIQTSSFGI